MHVIAKDKTNDIYLINYGIDPELKLSRAMGDIVHFKQSDFARSCVSIILENIQAHHDKYVTQPSELERMSSNEQKKLKRNGRQFCISQYDNKLSIDRLEPQRGGGAIGSEPEDVIWLEINASPEEFCNAIGINYKERGV